MRRIPAANRCPSVFGYWQFLYWLRDARTSEQMRQKAVAVLRQMLDHGEPSAIRFTRGPCHGWRRSPVGGSGGKQFYLWWIPRASLDQVVRRDLAKVLRALPDDAVYVRAVRHHDETSVPLTLDITGEWLQIGESMLDDPRSIVLLREKRVVEEEARRAEVERQRAEARAKRAEEEQVRLRQQWEEEQAILERRAKDHAEKVLREAEAQRAEAARAEAQRAEAQRAEAARAERSFLEIRSDVLDVVALEPGRQWEIVEIFGRLGIQAHDRQAYYAYQGIRHHVESGRLSASTGDDGVQKYMLAEEREMRQQTERDENVTLIAPAQIASTPAHAQVDLSAKSICQHVIDAMRTRPGEWSIRQILDFYGLSFRYKGKGQGHDRGRSFVIAISKMRQRGDVRATGQPRSRKSPLRLTLPEGVAASAIDALEARTLAVCRAVERASRSSSLGFEEALGVIARMGADLDRARREHQSGAWVAGGGAVVAAAVRYYRQSIEREVEAMEKSGSPLLGAARDYLKTVVEAMEKIGDVPIEGNAPIGGEEKAS